MPILQGLGDDYRIHIVQFTWGPSDGGRLQSLLQHAGIAYTRFEIRRKPVVAAGVLLTLFKGKRFLTRYIRAQKIDVVLPRSIFPALMVSGLAARDRSRRWVFDADGLPLEERVDFAGMNPRGLEFRWLKSVESKMIHRSDAVLVRSEKAIPFLAEGPFKVVTNGRDPQRYLPATPEDRARRRKEWGVTDQGIVLAYAGSLGPQYCLQEMLTLFEKAPPGSVLLLLTGNPEAAPERQGVIVRKLPPGEVAAYLGAADIGLALREPKTSMQGVFPIKLGEYLLCGLPVIATAGIGDTGTLLGGEASCLLLENHAPASLEKAALWAVSAAARPDLKTAARRLGLARFSLEESIRTYKRALDA